MPTFAEWLLPLHHSHPQPCTTWTSSPHERIGASGHWHHQPMLSRSEVKGGVSSGSALQNCAMPGWTSRRVVTSSVFLGPKHHDQSASHGAPSEASALASSRDSGWNVWANQLVFSSRDSFLRRRLLVACVRAHQSSAPAGGLPTAPQPLRARRAALEAASRSGRRTSGRSSGSPARRGRRRAALPGPYTAMAGLPLHVVFKAHARCHQAKRR